MHRFSQLKHEHVVVTFQVSTMRLVTRPTRRTLKRPLKPSQLLLAASKYLVHLFIIFNTVTWSYTWWWLLDHTLVTGIDAIFAPQSVQEVYLCTSFTDGTGSSLLCVCSSLLLGMREKCSDGDTFAWGRAENRKWVFFCCVTQNQKSEMLFTTWLLNEQIATGWGDDIDCSQGLRRSRGINTEMNDRILAAD